MNSFENIIFDLDGTLVDSQEDIKFSLKTAIAMTKGIEIDVAILKIGPPLDEMIRTMIPATSINEIDEIKRVFRLTYKNCGFKKTTCFSGMEILLRNLKGLNKRLYIATNKPGYLTNQIIEKLKIVYFNDICTIDTITAHPLSKKEMITLLIGKNQLDRNLTVHVGDSFIDVVSASENAISSIGVGYGYETKGNILKANPDFFFDTVTQLGNFLCT